MCDDDAFEHTASVRTQVLYWVDFEFVLSADAAEISRSQGR